MAQVHVSGAGDFQLSKIEVLKDPFPLNSRKKQDLMDSDEMHDAEVLTLNICYGINRDLSTFNMLFFFFYIVVLCPSSFFFMHITMPKPGSFSRL